MEPVPFGATGLTVSPLAFGAAPVGYLEASQAQADRLVGELLDRGVTFLDTAASYLASEELLGRALEGRRDRVTLLSKGGRGLPGAEGPDWSADVVTRTVDRSLRRLRTDHLDVMLLHSCPKEVLDRGEALGALLRAREAGKVRHVGYSGDNEALAAAAELPGVTVLMASASLCDQENLETLARAGARGLGVVAKRSLANAAWHSDQPGMYRGYAAPYVRRFQAMGLSLEALGFDGSWSDLALRFTLGCPGIHVASVGTTNPAHLEANLAAVAAGPLPDPLMETLREAFRTARYRAGEPWPGLT